MNFEEKVKEIIVVKELTNTGARESKMVGTVKLEFNS